MGEFDRFFKSAFPTRDKYHARMFGLVSESVVRMWCAQSDATYEDMGRPTLCELGTTRGHTLDFTLRNRSTGTIHVAESKCELEYENYRYLTLIGAGQIIHHTSTAFTKFLRYATDQSAYDVRLKGAPVVADGSILVWGAVTLEGRASAISHYGLADVLSIEAMVADLQRWSPPDWERWIEQYHVWTTEMFTFLKGESR